MGLFVVPVGELESWVPSVPAGNKSRWLTEVFDREHHTKPNAELQQFCEDIAAFFDSPGRRTP
ncbi:hypothetical protein ACIRST_41945 [Kitasatospora sp. NPDC101447]|uniref:hypothetical protein n=1 Tax=Kitasatospora sp. NPDC101447 TaxID=3364102 RepID=UPI00382D8ACA